MSRVRLGDRFYDDDVCYFKAGAQAADQCYGSCCAVTIRLKRIGVDSHTTTSSNSVVAPLAAVAGRILKVFASPKPAGNVALVISLPLVGAGISARVVALIAPAPFLPCDMTSAGARLPAEVYVNLWVASWRRTHHCYIRVRPASERDGFRSLCKERSHVIAKKVAPGVGPANTECCPRKVSFADYAIGADEILITVVRRVVHSSGRSGCFVRAWQVASAHCKTDESLAYLIESGLRVRDLLLIDLRGQRSQQRRKQQGQHEQPHG